MYIRFVAWLWWCLLTQRQNKQMIVCVYGILQTGCYAWISGCLFVFLSRSGDRLMLRWTKTTLYSQRRQLFSGLWARQCTLYARYILVCADAVTYLISLVDVKAAQRNEILMDQFRVGCSVLMFWGRCVCRLWSIYHYRQVFEREQFDWLFPNHLSPN